MMVAVSHCEAQKETALVVIRLQLNSYYLDYSQ